MRGRISFSIQNSKKSFTFTLVYTTYVPEYNSPSVLDLCQYFRQKKLKDYAAFLSSSSSFCCGVR